MEKSDYIKITSKAILNLANNVYKLEPEGKMDMGGIEINRNSVLNYKENFLSQINDQNFKERFNQLYNRIIQRPFTYEEDLQLQNLISNL